MSFSLDDLQQIFSGEMEYVLFLNNGSLWKVNPQSCDCDNVLIKMKNRDALICLECEKGVLALKEVRSFDSDTFNLKHTPPEDAHISFVSAQFNENGVEGLKFKYRDRFMYFFAEEDGWLIITICQWDIFEEDDTPMPDYDDSDLYFERI